MSFKLTDKQMEAQKVFASDATHILLEGGSRSGKTSLIVRNIILRSQKAAESRHLIARYRFNHVKQSIVLDTFPKIMKGFFPGLEYEINKSDWYAHFENKSQIWFGGLDEKDRAEKILGNEYITIYPNETSQIPYDSRNLILTRLAQKAHQIITVDKSGAKKELGLLKPRMYYDWNPTNKGHWCYKIFHRHIDPESGKPLINPQDYVSFLMNPVDNEENLSPDYLKILKSMSTRAQKRFLKGEAQEETAGQLFNDVDIEKWRHTHGEIPDMVRVVVAVDPSGSGDTDNADNDAIGIVIGGLGVDGNAYIMEDATVKAGPGTWGRVATQAYERHEANTIVAEVNYGGAMVEHVIQTARPRTPFKMITSTRGKHIRAEPMSALYEQGKVRHIGFFPELEEELCNFTTYGYVGDKSPNRADAAIFVLAELFQGIVKDRVLPKQASIQSGSRLSFMAN